MMYSVDAYANIEYPWPVEVMYSVTVIYSSLADDDVSGRGEFVMVQDSLFLVEVCKVVRVLVELDVGASVEVEPGSSSVVELDRRDDVEETLVEEDVWDDIDVDSPLSWVEVDS
jgi:hypothetical protein